MSYFEDFTKQATSRGKSVLDCVADIFESMTKHNLALASDVAGFAVSQVRLPTEAKDLGDFSQRQRDAYRKFAEVMKSHSQKIVASMREIPEQLAESWKVETVQPAAPKAGPAKRTTAKKTATRKTSPKRAAANK